MNLKRYRKFKILFFRPLLITSQTIQENENENENNQKEIIAPQLRFSVIKFLKNFCEEGIDEILKMEGIYQKLNKIFHF